MLQLKNIIVTIIVNKKEKNIEILCSSDSSRITMTRVVSSYSEKEKLEALKLWLVTGNLMGTAAALRIPYETVKTWRYSKWWGDMSVEIKAEGRLELSAKLKKIAEKALGETLDRLENGDVRISPTGELERVPVTAAVASKIATDFLGKSQELESVQNEASLQSVQDRLKSIADSMEKLSRKVRKVEVFDAIPVEKTSSVDVLPEAGDGETVGQGDSGYEEITYEQTPEAR